MENKTFQLEHGKTYRTRDGHSTHKVEYFPGIVRDISFTERTRDGKVFRNAWSPEGKWFRTCGAHLDLVEEVC